MKNLGSNFRLIVAVTFFVTIGSVWIQPSIATPASCILNCAQCVQIFGEFFDGHSCAQVCLDTRAKFESFIDCADPTNIARFIKTSKTPPNF